MKLGNYNPQVNLKTIEGHTSVPSDMSAYGGNAQGMEGLNKGLSLAMKAVEDNEAINVTAADTEYAKRINNVLYNQDNGLLNTQQQGSAGIAQTFQEQERKIRQEIIKEFGIAHNKSQIAFNTMANKDAITRYNAVSNHEYKQMEAYKDTTFSNAIQDKQTYAMENYGDDLSIQNSLDDIAKLTTIRFASQGSEVVKSKVRAAAANVFVGGASIAMQNGDTSRAEALLDRGAAAIPIGARIALTGQIAKMNAANTDLLNNKALYAKYGDDTAAAMADIEGQCKSSGANFDKIQAGYNSTKGFTYSLGAAEDSNSQADCGSWTRRIMAGAGVSLNNRCADAQADQMDAEGKYFTDKSQLKQGDLVFWTGTGGEEGSKGISHVGIYWGNGKAMQMGTHGVGLMALDSDAGTFVGGGRTSTTSYSPAQIEAKKNAYLGYYTKQNSLKRNQQNTALQNGYDAMLDLYTQSSGTATPEQYQAIAGKYAIDNHTTTVLNAKAASYFGGGGGRRTGSGGGSGSNNGGASLSENVLTGLENELRHNTFKDFSEYMDYVNRNFDVPNLSTRNKIEKIWQNYQEGTGTFKLDYSGAISMAMAGQSRSDNPALYETQKIGLEQDLPSWSREFIAANGREPTMTEMAAYAKSSLTKASYGSVEGEHFWNFDKDLKYSKAELCAADITNAKVLPSGQILVKRKNGSEAYLTPGALQREVEGQ